MVDKYVQFLREYLQIGKRLNEPGPEFYNKDHKKNYNTGEFDGFGQYKLFILKELIKDKNAKIIEVGCGTGEVLVPLSKEGYSRCVGIDHSSFAVTKAIKRAKDNDVQVSFLEGSAYEVPEGDYDNYLLLDVIEHLEDPLNSLKSFHDRMKEGSKLLIITPNIFHETNLIKISMDERPNKEPRAHIHMFSYWSLLNMIKEAGFTNVRVYGFQTKTDVDLRTKSPKLQVFLIMEALK